MFRGFGGGLARKAAGAVALVAVVLVLGAVLTRVVDRQPLAYDDATRAWEAEVLSDIVDIGGVRCVPKRNVRAYLIMGIDDTASRGENYVTGGQSDVLMLVAVDHTDMTYRRLAINRNTMCEVHSFDLEGEDVGSVECQIALAHAQGDGGAMSCENAVRAVSELLYGVEIDNYIALEMAAIPTVNHLVGGVTVTIEDDFSASDPSLKMGQTVTLTDRQAMNFVHDRMNIVSDDTNEGRMRRQEAYMDGLREKLLALAREDGTYALQVYDALEPSMVTNMNGKAFSRFVNGLTACEALENPVIAGRIGEDELGFATFEPDAESLRDAVISMFYRPVETEEAEET